MTKRPWQFLPQPPPKDLDPSVEELDFFYKNFANPLVKDFVRLMCAGLSVDVEEVDKLRKVVVDVVNGVHLTLSKNPVIVAFQEAEYPKVHAEMVKEMEKRKRPLSKFLKPYKATDKIHRTYLMNEYLQDLGLVEYLRKEWLVNDVKALRVVHQSYFIDQVLDKTLPVDNRIAEKAMATLAATKMAIYNKSHCDDKIEATTREELMPPFNPNSSKQLQKLFEFMDVEPLAFSKKTGDPSWGRDQIEETLKMETDEDRIEMLQAFVDFSYSNIIKTNFMEAFDKFLIDGKLHGSIKNFGAKSYRPTSQLPNMLNMPSTGSIYAKPLKKCFIAPPGYVVWTIDYSALNSSGVSCSNV